MIGNHLHVSYDTPVTVRPLRCRYLQRCQPKIAITTPYAHLIIADIMCVCQSTRLCSFVHFVSKSVSASTNCSMCKRNTSETGVNQCVYCSLHVNPFLMGLWRTIACGNTHRHSNNIYVRQSHMQLTDNNDWV